MTYPDCDVTFFDEWMRELDDLMFEQAGLSVHDVPDLAFRIAYGDGVTPTEFYEDTVLAELVALGWHESDLPDPYEAE